MNVALLSFEMTVHSHFFTPNTSSGTSMVHVGFNVDLTRQTAAFARFAFADVGQLGWQNVAAAAFHDNTALTT